MAISLRTALEEGTLESAGYCPKCQGKECKCEQAFGEEKLDYTDQLKRKITQAWKDRDAEAYVYYTIAQKSMKAIVSWDRYKGSSVYPEWRKLHEKEIQAIEKDMKSYRYSSRRAPGYVEESDASAEAKELNLVHVGFGNYAQKEGGPILYRTIDGVLTRVGETEPAKKPKVIKKTGEEPEASKEIEPQDVYGKKKATIQKVGVTDIKLVDEEDQIYTFRYNGHPGRIKLSEEEIIQLSKTEITNIILGRIKRKIARLKAQQKVDAEAPSKNEK